MAQSAINPPVTKDELATALKRLEDSPLYQLQKKEQQENATPKTSN